MTQNKTYFNWSGGKDSALALYHAQRSNGYKPDLLLTSVNDTFKRISMHGVRQELLDMQAVQIGLPLRTIALPEGLTMPAYNEIMGNTVTELQAQGYNNTVFGDIFLEDLRVYREEQLKPFGITAHFPLWKRDTKELLTEFLDLGFKTILVCIKSELLDKSFAGRIIDRDFIKDLPKNVDACGENGEFHTFVFDGPIFDAPIEYEIGEVVYREYTSPKDDKDVCFSASPSPQMGFWFCDLLPAQVVAV
ncbi:MAG: ATP-binding protein [Bacteroidetes bacterium]|nr:ATP-binding protein [Bacteroidota bacterium]